MRRALATAAFALLGVLLVAFALLFAVSHGLGRARLVAALERRLTDALGAPVAIGALEGTLHDRIRLRDVAIGPPEALRADDIEIDLDLLRLRDRVVRIDALRISGLAAAVETTQEGVRLPALPQDGEPAEPGGARPVALEIGRIELAGARIAVASDAAPDATHALIRADGEAQDFAWPASGSPRLPASASVALATEDARVAGRAIEQGVLRATLTGDTVRVEQLGLEGAFGKVGASLDGALGGPAGLRSASGTIGLTRVDLAPLLADPRFASSLVGEIEVGMDAEQRIEASAEIVERAERGAPIGTLRGRGVYDPATQAWRIQSLAVEGALLELDAKGAGRGRALESLTAQVASLDLAALPKAWAPVEPLAGIVTLSVEAAGDGPIPSGALALDARELRGPGFGPATLSLRATSAGDGAIRVDRFALEEPRGRVAVAPPARLRIVERAHATAVAIDGLALETPGGSAKIEGVVSQSGPEALRVALDLLLAELPLEADVAGRLTGSLVLDGAFAEPRVEGQLAIDSLAMRGRSVDRIGATLRTEGARIVAELDLHDAGERRLEATASLARAGLASPATLLARDDTRVALRAPALDLAWLANLLDAGDLGVEGRLALDAAVTGAAPLPRVTGTLRVADAVAKPKGRPPIGPVRLAIRLDGAAAVVSELIVPSGEGALRGEGRIAWSEAAEIDTDLDLRLEAFALPPGLPAQGVLDGALALRGRPPALAIEGALSLEDATITLPEASDPTWSEIRIHGDPRAAEPAEPIVLGAPPAWLAPLRIDVVLTIEDAAAAGRGADVVADGRVRVLKQAGDPEPTYAGSIRVENGRFQYRDRVFRIERGVVTLAGTRSVDPQLDIVAEREIDDVRLRVTVSGRASTPRVTLSSDPPLPETDLLSYLAFDRPASSLRSDEATQLSSAATQVVGSLVAGQLGATLGGIPTVGGFALSAGGDGVALRGNIAPGVSVSAVQGFGRLAQSLRVEWRFDRRWSLESEARMSGESGIDLIWQREY